ncbi:MAG: membrane protein insertase YidC [Rikenellaceae bacterium]
MDKNTIIALIAGVVLLGGYIFYSSKEQERYQVEVAQYNAKMEARALAEAEAKAKADAKAAAELQLTTTPTDSLTAEQIAMIAHQKSVNAVGEALTAAMNNSEQSYTLENDVLKIDFTSRGAQVADVTLKDYTKYSDEERTELVKLFDPSSAKMDFEFYIRNGLNNVKVNTTDYNFVALPIQSVEGGERLTFVLDFGGNAAVEYTYTLYNGEDDSRNYLIDFDVNLRNMTPVMANQSSIGIDWRNTSYQNERGFKNENTYTSIAYHFKGENSIDQLGISEDGKSDKISTAIEWIAFKQQYFTSAFIAHENFSYADISYSTAKPYSGYMKSFTSKMSVPYTSQTEGYNFALYFGPNKYKTLKGLNDLGYGKLEMDEVIPLGWGIFGWVNKFVVIPTFDFLRKYIGNFGIIILILAFGVKLIISPLTYSSYVSMGKMRVIKPEVDVINAKYPKQEDAMKRQQATMELYKKAGINPMGGCIPMLIQMPIIIAMFRFFPASIELREQPFLWASDLSSYDSILNLPFNIPFYGDHVSLFALLMTASMFVYSYLNYQQSASSQPQMAGMKFMMVYMMPAMMLLWFNGYSSGLCFYYLLSNLLTIGQTMVIRNMIDDDKIHAIMKANSAKNKNGGKKSKFQQRYEELMAEQQRLQAEQKKK